MSHRGRVRGQARLSDRRSDQPWVPGRRWHDPLHPHSKLSFRGWRTVSLGGRSLRDCGVPFLGPGRRRARHLGKAETGSHMPSRPDRGLVAPHLRKRSDKATAWSPTRAATAAGCSRTCRLLLPGDVEGWRGPQNRVAAQLPERRRARRRRPPNKPFRRRPRRPRGPSAWPRPSSVGRTRSPCVWRNHRLHAAGTTFEGHAYEGAWPVTGHVSDRGGSGLKWVECEATGEPAQASKLLLPLESKSFIGEDSETEDGNTENVSPGHVGCFSIQLLTTA